MTATVNHMGGYVHNPRGNLWMNDDSTLGHRLLVKMGWSRGKGLGKNEDGIKENLKVRFKNTVSGFGWKDESFNKVQSIEYDSLLKRISEKSMLEGRSSIKNKNKSKNYELRSQTSGKRWLYHKFMKEKSISNFSKKDMKSIFITDAPSVIEKEEICGTSPNNFLFENSFDKACSNQSSLSPGKVQDIDEGCTKSDLPLSENMWLESSLSQMKSNAFLKKVESSCRLSKSLTVKVMESDKTNQISKSWKERKNTTDEPCAKKLKLDELASNSKNLDDQVSHKVNSCPSDYAANGVRNSIDKPKKRKRKIHAKSCIDNENCKQLPESVSFTKDESSCVDNENCKQLSESVSFTKDESMMDKPVKIEDDLQYNIEIPDGNLESNHKGLLSSCLVAVEKFTDNCWIENQRQARKMSLYKNMLIRLKKHEVLRTCNLLSIKGYGN